MRIVHVAPSLAGTGGAFAPALRSLAAAQARMHGGRVLVVAAGPEAQQTRADDLEFRTLPAGRPGCLGRSPALRQHLANCPLEVVHAHCVGERGLHYAHLAAQRHGAPLVVSPALALGLGAGDRLRLRCFVQRVLVHPQALETAAGWHATSAEEASAIHACGFRQPVCIAPPGVVVPRAADLEQAREWWRARHPQLAGRPVALCLAEASRPARLRDLISLWGASFTADWLLLVLAADPASATALAAHAGRHGAADRVLVAVQGDAPPHGAARLLLGVDPASTSLATVAGGLAAGLPALVTDTGPWSRLGAANAGWCVPWREFGPALRHALELDHENLDTLGRNALALARAEFDWAHSAERLLGFYANLRR